MYKYFTERAAGRRSRTTKEDITNKSRKHYSHHQQVYSVHHCDVVPVWQRRKEFTVKHFHPAWREKRSFITSRMNSHSNARDSDIPLCTVHDRNITAGSIIILYTSGRIDRLQTRESSVDLHLPYTYTKVFFRYTYGCVGCNERVKDVAT